MIDTKNAKWEFSASEKGAIKWLEDNGFTGNIEKQYASKTIFAITKNGIMDRFELPAAVGVENIKAYMQQFERSFEMLCKIKNLTSR